MSLCIIYSTITVSNANSYKYTVTRKIVHRVHRGLGLDESEFTKSVLVFIFYFIRPYNIRELGLWLRLECSLDCISGPVGYQQNIFILSLSAFLLK